MNTLQKHAENYTENGLRRHKDQGHGFVDNVESILVPFCEPSIRVPIFARLQEEPEKLIHRSPHIAHIPPSPPGLYVRSVSNLDNNLMSLSTKRFC